MVIVFHFATCFDFCGLSSDIGKSIGGSMPFLVSVCYLVQQWSNFLVMFRIEKSGDRTSNNWHQHIVNNFVLNGRDAADMEPFSLLPYVAGLLAASIEGGAAMVILSACSGVETDASYMSSPISSDIGEDIYHVRSISGRYPCCRLWKGFGPYSLPCGILYECT
jgi:hypothetical protein